MVSSRRNEEDRGRWLYLDAEVLVLPPVFLPQDFVFVGRRLRRHPTLAALGLAET